MKDKISQIPYETVFTLIKKWVFHQIITKEQIKLYLITLLSNRIVDERNFIEEIMDKNDETEIVHKTKDIYFGFTSSYPSVVNEALKIKRISFNLPKSIINIIVKKRNVHLFVDTAYYELIIRNIREKGEFYDVVESLNSNNQNGALITFLSTYYDIPKELIVPSYLSNILTIVNNHTKD